MGTLRELFDKHGSDKGSKKHRYDRCYEQFFEPVRNDEINLLEIGCFRGDSTSAFREYFPNGNIYTIDIFERHSADSIDALKLDRVHWLQHDTMHKALPLAIRNKWGDIEFDFIIDDGAHFPIANRLTFENCVSFLKEGGSYFIEDVWMLGGEAKSPKVTTNNWIKRKPELYDVQEHYRLLDTLRDHGDVDHYDFTTTNVKGRGGYPDGYILRVS
jgi:hypothetical protein